MSGCAQWWPALMHTFSLLKIVAMSCGWMSLIVNEMFEPDWFVGGRCIVTSG